jgi:hypothetical protein
MMANCQRLPEESPIGKGHDITGRTFGLLTAVRCVERSEAGNRWLLQCECGRWAIHGGVESMCSECANERWTRKYADFRSGFALMFDATGALYSRWSDERHKADIASGCAEALGVTIDLALPVSFAQANDVEEASPFSSSPLRQLQAPKDYQYKCITCDALFTTGFGCLSCIEPVCFDCVDMEIHECWIAPQTLEQVGTSIGRSREAVRHIEATALRKIARAMKLLVADDAIRPQMSGGRERSHCGEFVSRTSYGLHYCPRCGRTWPKGSGL